MTAARNISQAVQLVVALLLLVQSGGAARDPATTQAAPLLDLDGLHERALRDLPEFVNHGATRFLVRGFDDAGDPVDPSNAFLARFDDIQPPVKPASSARRVSRAGGEIARNSTYHYEDPETGRRAQLFYVLVLGRRGDSEARVRVGYTSGPLTGGGREAIYKFTGKEWKLEKVVSEFMS